MKKQLFSIFFLLLSVLLITAPASAISTKNCDFLTGGAARSLDRYSVDDLGDGDRARVIIKAKNIWQIMEFVYDSSGTTIEQVATHPYTIRPDDYSSAGVWVQVEPTGLADQTTGVTVIPSAAFPGIYIDQNNNAYGLYVDSESTSSMGLYILGMYPARIVQDIADGRALSIERNNAAAAETFELVYFRNANSADTQATLKLSNAGSGDHIITALTNEDLKIDPAGTGGVSVFGGSVGVESGQTFFLNHTKTAGIFASGGSVYIVDNKGNSIDLGDLKN